MPGAAPDLIEKMYDCFNRGDLETLRNEVFASDMVWRLPSRHPLGGIYRGVDQVLAFFAAMGPAFQVDVERIDTFGDDALIEVHTFHGRTESGVTLEGQNCIRYTVKDGKLAEAQVFTSDQYGLDNFFWAAYQLAPIPTRLTG
jgi:uncharacterized protein